MTVTGGRGFLTQIPWTSELLCLEISKRLHGYLFFLGLLLKRLKASRCTRLLTLTAGAWPPPGSKSHPVVSILAPLPQNGIGLLCVLHVFLVSYDFNLSWGWLA